MRTKAERLDEFFRRLAAAPAAASHDEAFRLLCDTLNRVEDELCDEPYDPSAWTTQDRMYPPQEDAARPVADHPAVTRYRSRGHNSFVAVNGAVEIRDMSNRALFEKPGADGKGVWE